MSLRVSVLVVIGCVGISGTARGQDAELQKKINTAIDNGVAYLKGYNFGALRNKFRPEDQVRGEVDRLTGYRDIIPPSQVQIGAMALAGWTLLESIDPGKDPRKDPVVRALADEVRERSHDIRFTYAISLALIFLEKLDDPGDFPLIESLTVRLLAGHNQYGGWSYYCDGPNQAEAARLAAHVRETKNARDAGKKIVRQNGLSPQIIQQLQQLAKRPWNARPAEQGDNSNTQFAMMALWRARQQGLPTQPALAIVEQRFRTSPLFANGGWAYRYEVDKRFKADIPDHRPKMSMTCAGIMGIALGVANANVNGINKDVVKDPQVKAALEALGTSIEKKGPLPPEENYNSCYFWFSLERTMVPLGVKQLGDRDWYLWGAQFLVDDQDKRDGSWKGGQWDKMAADTCFALLFLKRVNIAPELADILKGQIIAAPKKDPKAGKLFEIPIQGSPLEKPKKGPSKQSSRVEPRVQEWRAGLAQPALERTRDKI